MRIQTNQKARTGGHPIGLASARLAGLLLIAVEQALAVEPRHAGEAPPSIPAADSVAALAQKVPAPMTAGSWPTERRIIISLPDRKLILVSGGRVVKAYRVAVGARSTPSPAGQFTIATRIPNPTWYRPGKVVGPGKDNPVGTRWVGLDRKGYGIHGTNEPSSIGRAASHGCIRMRNRDVEELFKLVRVGDAVEITAESETTAVAQALAGADGFAAVALSQSAGQPGDPQASTGRAQDEARLGQ